MHCCVIASLPGRFYFSQLADSERQRQGLGWLKKKEKKRYLYIKEETNHQQQAVIFFSEQTASRKVESVTFTTVASNIHWFRIIFPAEQRIPKVSDPLPLLQGAV